MEDFLEEVSFEPSLVELQEGIQIKRVRYFQAEGRAGDEGWAHKKAS